MTDKDIPDFEPEQPEDLRLENEILKLKLQAETGAVFEGSENLPPEMENEFLHHVMAFEEAARNVKRVKVYELIGRPGFRKCDELQPDEIKTELARMHDILNRNKMELDVLGEYDDSTIYRFITEELFEHETDDFNLPGMITHFTYEEFHPNHKMDIEARTLEFVEHWFERKMDTHCWELSDSFILPDNTQLNREQVVAKMTAFFDAFPEFYNCQSNIDDVSFQWNETEQTGLGHAEGTVRYNARMENGEQVLWEGPFKLYLSNTYGWWSVFYFVFPGFCW